MKTEQKGTLFVIISALMWGVSGVTVQYSYMQNYFTTGQIVGVRLLTTGVLLLIYNLMKKDAGIYRIFKDWRDVLGLAFFSIVGMAGVQYTFFATVEESNSPTASILQFLYPVIVLFIVTRQQRRMPTGLESFRIALAIVGTFLIATHGQLGSLAITKEALGWGLASAMCMALYTVYSKRIVAKWGTWVVNGWGMFFGGIVIALISHDEMREIQWSVGGVVCLWVIVLMGTLIPFGLYLKGVLYVGGIKASALCCIETLAILVWAVILFGQKLEPGDVAGIVCIISAVVIPAVLEQREKKKKNCLDMGNVISSD
ncbi:DMT family transporter [Hespellia stercorisuis]|uniref:Permease of the drug/metabolite transporter (DMT) superfamily n=1 Tax=Hespellia stercorisuis DSM 15480 TaxID=1121950 RepID=A0A1M6IZY8_9FIRM|nr:DMT family transporter [Hespellia stercorisuis]SHJ39977.1 Permease of the drug/metabolite transporter (DMT) superfamily [Hespellia stercorisuis DSM 15480]